MSTARKGAVDEMSQPPGTVSVPEACRQLGVGRQRLYQLVEMGRLGAVRDGRRLWVLQESINARRAGRSRLESTQCITTQEVADFFGVDERTVREWYRMGQLHAHRINNRLCFSPGDVITFDPPGHSAGRPPGRVATRTLRGRYYPPTSQPKGTSPNANPDPE